MRDIRQDLKERLDKVNAEIAAKQTEIAELENQAHLLKAVLEEEQQQWNDNNSVVLIDPIGDLSDVIHELLDSGEPWFTSQIASIAEKRGYKFGERKPGRSVHFTLLAMARRGEIENVGFGRWRKKQRKEQVAS